MGEQHHLWRGGDLVASTNQPNWTVMEAEEAKNAERMRALRYKTHASSAALMIENVERPVPKANELLLQTIAVGLNPLDIKLLKNPINEIMGLKLPFIPGRDFTAIVIDNSRVEDSRFQIGSIVWGITPNPMKDGSLCEVYLSVGELRHSGPEKTGHALRPCVVGLNATGGADCGGELGALFALAEEEE